MFAHMQPCTLLLRICHQFDAEARWSSESCCVQPGTLKGHVDVRYESGLHSEFPPSQKIIRAHSISKKISYAIAASFRRICLEIKFNHADAQGESNRRKLRQKRVSPHIRKYWATHSSAYPHPLETKAKPGLTRTALYGIVNTRIP